MEKRRVILWFRNDLRSEDNEALREAIDHSDEVYPVYVLDDRVVKGESHHGLRKTDVHRAKFILESVHDLRQTLQGLGSNLLVCIGKPEEIIADLAHQLKTSWVFCNRERTAEELYVQDTLEQNLWSIGQEVRYSRGKMLYYTSDLPFPITHTPDVFTQFRKEVEKIVPVRLPIPAPEHIETDQSLINDWGAIPTLAELDFETEDIQRAEGGILSGGESAGIERLKHYLWETEGVSNYKDTRNGLLGLDYSSKLSPYLSQGCISPKTVYHELQRYEQKHGANDSTYHLFFELLWRDFFRLMGKKHGNSIFKRGGIKEDVREDLNDDMALFRIWAEGRTGYPFVDAAMREIHATGFMSNRARQNVASFLVNNLGVNWQIGAEYFESLLIDYDPCSNWGNWNYVSGVGCDPRENRCFNILAQARRYDPQGEFVRHWLPELSQLPTEYIHQPYLMDDEQQATHGITLAKDYPNPIVRIED